MKEYQEPVVELIDFTINEDIYANCTSNCGVSGGEPSINIGGW